MSVLRQLFYGPSIDEPRVRELFEEQHQSVLRWTDYLFAWLLPAQWLAAIAAAIWISPLTWAGADSQVHAHVYAAVFLGLGIVALPVTLAWMRPGTIGTRHMIAVAQALMSALLIHLMGGRIETHFHVFGSLALLAFYRDWKVLITSSVVVAADHFVRGLFWPQSVYGTSIVSPWRFAEHAGWVLVEDVFLILSCQQGLREMLKVAERQASLETAHRLTEDSNMQLREEILERERTQHELERAKTVAEAANVAKSEFLANMSHELRTPLNAIIGFSDVLSEKIYGPLNESQQGCVTDVLESGQHLLSLVNDILDLAKIESGTMDMDWGNVDLTALVLRLGEMSRERATRQGVQLRVDACPRLKSVRADERRIKQLLYNFISNAIKFTPEGGQITIRAQSDQENVILSVADTGVGIAPDEHQKIFESFYQVDSTLTKSKQGTGLGLALVRRIADLHHGRVWVESQVGKGSTFFIEWPGLRAAELAVEECLA
jgi:two-component system, sensor histidine kinase and response regulator